NLGIGSGTHGHQTGRILEKSEDVFIKEKPDTVLVYGDTNSTLAAALAAIKLHIPVIHVEAGPRQYDKKIPEEINRILIDHCSHTLLAPTQNSVKNLEKEGLTEGVYFTGDIMLDLAIKAKLQAEKLDTYKEYELEKNEYILTTLHRANNVDNKQTLSQIVKSLQEIKEQVVIPLHPRTEKRLKEYKLYQTLENIKIIKPLGYLNFTNLLLNCKKVLTDSGGVQKEAYFAKKPCITIMDYSPWIETIQDGWNTLANSQNIKQKIETFQPTSKQNNAFGDGHAGQKTVKIIQERYP
ncbi:UDP-N-acetylglucosamine 2-epimerase (non-hydrolyzing), partial [archaeon]|nr:UDP-N-acetylglucosamine 2-epimerase (non-hydrolyzing) [archaeon]